MPRVSTLKLPILDIDPKSIGTRFVLLCKQKGKTQVDLAR
jgi:hypothetical protein